MWNNRTRIGYLILVLALVLARCGGGERGDILLAALPAAGDVPNWTPEGDVRTFDQETLYDLVNGQAESFFVYGFQRVATRRYTGAGGATLHVEVWQLTTPVGAYGLFSANVAGTPVEGIGAGGDADPGRRLAFWQDRYFINVRALQETDQADLEAVARFIAASLPAGGEPPALVDALPPDGLATRVPRFFHQEISIQDVVWLGGENVLGLGPETDGVLARYELGGTTAWLMLVDYPEPSEAAAARGALEGSGVEDLAAVEADGARLGAVFGQVDAATANALLTQALGDEWVSFVLDRPMVAVPGTTFNYNTGATHLLGAILEQATGMPVEDYARQRLFEPLHISTLHWSTDPDGIAFAGGGLSLTPRDMAKFGYLYLAGGVWEGEQIVSAARSTAPLPENPQAWEMLNARIESVMHHQNAP